MTAVAGRAAAAVAAAIATTAFLPMPTASAAVYFRAETAATAVHLTVTQQPASSIVTASLVDDATAYVAADFDTSGSSEALAAPAFPGKLVTQGPQLLCSEVFTCPAPPPAYPLLADATYPRRTNDRSTVQGRALSDGPLAVTPLRASAHAGRAGNRAQTSVGQASVLHGAGGAVAIGASHATTDVTSSASRLVVHVESTVDDVTVAGLLRIDSVQAVDDLTLTAAHRPVDRPRITVSGVRVAGVPASIDGRGVHVAGIDGPSLSRRLTQAGISVRTVGVHRKDGRAVGRSDATGLEIDVALPVHGIPYVPNPLPPLPPPFDQIPALPGVDANGTYVGHVTLGAVGVVGGLGSEQPIDVGGAGPLPVLPSASGPAASSTAPPAAAAAALPAPAAPGQVPPAVALPPRTFLRGFVDLLDQAALDHLYAVLALGTAALFVGWRLAVLAGRRAAGDGRQR